MPCIGDNAWFVHQVSPEILREHGVSVSVTVQRQGEFVLVFPHAYTATLCCGYNIAESIRYAPLDWIPLGYKMAEVRCRNEQS